MNFTIQYHELVVTEDIPKLDGRLRKQIRHAIEMRLMTQPELYGKPLRRSLHGYWTLRVGDYRIIYKIGIEKVKILIIGHRSMVYEKLLARIR